MKKSLVLAAAALMTAVAALPVRADGRSDARRIEMDRLQSVIERRMPDMVQLARRAELEPEAGRQVFKFPSTYPVGESRMVVRFVRAQEELPPYGCDREGTILDNTYLMTTLSARAEGERESEVRVVLYLIEQDGRAQDAKSPYMVVDERDAASLSSGKVALRLDAESGADFRVDGRRQALDDKGLYAVLKAADQAGSMESERVKLEEQRRSQDENLRDRMERLRDALGGR